MKRIALTASLAAVAALAPGLYAQSAQPNAAVAGDKVVAEVNGDVITQSKLDQLWNRMSERTRHQYEKSGGGKAGFLENYVGKRLVVQQAQKSGFDKRADVQAELEAAKESALFDRYIRDVVAASVVTDDQVRSFYDQNRKDFTSPERAQVLQIFVGTANRTPADAKARIASIMAQLHSDRVKAPSDAERRAAFLAIASKESEDPGHGDMGWVTQGTVDPALDAAIFSMKTGIVSGIIEASDGYHLVLVENREPGSVEPFDNAKAGIREFLLSQNAQKVVEQLNKLTSDLRAKGSVKIYKENVK